LDFFAYRSNLACQSPLSCWHSAAWYSTLNHYPSASVVYWHKPGWLQVSDESLLAALIVVVQIRCILGIISWTSLL
jgi:hypothetical protein